MEAISSQLEPWLYVFYSYWTGPHLITFGACLSFSFKFFIFDDSNPTAFLRISDSDISRFFLRYITYQTGFKNCEATKTLISRIALSALFLTFISILISNIFLYKALSKVAVPILFNTKSFSWNSIFSNESTTVISSFFSLNGVIITSKPSNLY